MDLHASVLVHGDSARLQQIVWNLLTNAIKFTPRGGSISVGCTAGSDSATIVVKDTGEGIDPDYLARVFDRFSQGESSSTRRHGGLGLGLSIVRHLVEMHGGTVEAQSAGAGQGATFTVRLPLLRPGMASESSAQSRPINIAELPLRGVQVLIVDDEEDTRDFVTFALEGAGATIVTAATADQGIEAFRNASPAVVLADLSMPEKDGFALLQALRALNPKVPVLALTALARADDRSRSLEAGFDFFLTKPVDPGELVAVVAALNADGRHR
jgi:CheY-like chemotaxis protein/anti-sigma regulatory factor (Ser/Thr protein kinase)